MRQKRIAAGILTAIVILALYLRLAHLDLAEFKRDEATIALMATELLAGRSIPLTGIGTSVPGLDNGPLMIYLVALPLALARDAALASGFIGLLNVLALIVTCRFTERAFGRMAALFCGATYAVASWAVIFSRKLWPNEAMPVFSALLALAVYEAVALGRPRGVALAGLWLAALINLHPSGAIFAPFVILALCLRPSVLRTRWTLVGLAAGIVVSAPFILHEARLNFPGIRALQSVAGRGARIDTQAIELAAAMVGPEAYAALAGDAQPQFRAATIMPGPLGDLMPWLVVVGILLAISLIVRGVRRSTGWRGPAIALLFAVVPIAVASRQSIPLQIHYLIPVVPALFPLIGVALALPSRFIRPSLPFRRTLAMTIPALFVVWASVVQVQHFWAFTDLVRANGGQTLHGVPLIQQRTAVERAISYAGDRPISLVTQPGADGADDLPPIWRFLTPPSIGLEFDDGGGALRFGTSSSLFVVAPSADSIASEQLGARGVPAGRGVLLPGRPRGYDYWRAMARPAADRPGLGRLENGLRLVEVISPDRITNGDRVVSIASWRLERRPAAEQLVFFTQLLDDSGSKVVGTDRGGVDTSSFDSGDEIVTWAQMPEISDLRPGRYWLSLGAYQSGNTSRIPSFDASGALLPNGLRVGPIKVALPTVSSTPSSARVARFEDGIELMTVAIPARATAQSTIAIDLIWCATFRPSRDYTVFVHLIDASGKVIAQVDRQPIDGTYPTSIWDRNELVSDRITLTAPAGEYRVAIGLYDSVTQKRLGRTDQAGDFAPVGSIVVGQ